MAGSARRADPKLKASLALEVFALGDLSLEDHGIRHGNSTCVVLPFDCLLEFERRDRQELILLVEAGRIGRTPVGLRLEGMVQRLYQ